MKKTILFITSFVVLTAICKSQTVTDIDGNTYNTITIGTQTWLKENLKVTKLNDNTDIPLVTDNMDWAYLSTPGYCWYDNDMSMYGSYGLLYNWYTVNTGNLCPSGWHVPTDAEWTELVTYVGGEYSAGGKLKEIGNAWSSPNSGATNEFGFSALPGGMRNGNGNFSLVYTNGHWWSSTLDWSGNAWYRTMSYNQYAVYSSNIDKHRGYSVRCLKDYSTGINNINNNEFNIYPNPAKDLVRIEYTGNETSIAYIFNTLGELVLSTQLTPGTNETNVSELAQGLYIIKIISSAGEMQYKLIKE